MDLLILGASARAAAHSAVRAGLRPAAVDLFADLDLAAVAPSTRRVDRGDFPDGLERLAAEIPFAPWLYTGALENSPDLVDRIGRARPLWGNPGSVLRAVRDPMRLADALRRAGLPHPGVRLDPIGLPRDGRWLVKPTASAGGRKVRVWDEDQPIPRFPAYYQERISGPSLAAIVSARPDGANLLGVSRQWVGGLGDDFTYRGSVGPWPLDESARGAVERMGRAIASAFGLAGLFGVDFILKDGLPWPVEVNPRYTASVEVLELALGRPFLIEHARAFDPGLAERLRPIPAPSSRPAVVGKAYLFAAAQGRFPGVLAARIRPDAGYAVPRCADLPRSGQDFEAGEPVLTVFSRGATVGECWRRLQRMRDAWMSRLGGSGSSREKPAGI